MSAKHTGRPPSAELDSSGGPLTGEPDPNVKARRELRARAEAAWRASHKGASVNLDEIAKLVYELDVDWIELEQQNEELRRSQSDLEESRHQFIDLYDFAPVGYLTIDQHTVIAQANLTMARMLGLERSRLVGQRLQRFVSRKSQDSLYKAQRAVDSDGTTWSGELVLRQADGVEFPISMEMLGVGGGDTVLGWRCAVIDITTRQAAEQALRASEERYRRLAEQLVDGIFVVDSQGRYVDANHAGCDMLGYTLEELKTLTVNDALAPVEFPRLPEQFRRLATGELIRNEWCFKRKDGSTFDGELVARRLPDGRLQGVVRNVTEQKRSAQALLRQLEFERFLFELSRTFIGLPEAEVDVNMARGLAQVGEFLGMDRVTLLELSRDRAELTVAYSWSAPGASSAPPVIAQSAQPWWVSQVLRGKVSLASRVDDLPAEAAAEKAYLRKRGVVSAASIPLKVGGEIAGAISFVTVQRRELWTEELVNQLRAIGDILWNALRRHQAMQALLAAQSVVRESEERFRLAMNNVAAGVYTLDLDGNVTFMNPAAEAIFGWTNAELVGQKMHNLTHHLHLDGTPYPASECPVQQILQTGIELRERQDTFIRKDGGFFPVVFSASPLKKDGTTVGIVVGFRDDTLRRDAERAEREREALRAREEDSRRKDEFLAFLGHELRNPLAAIHTAVHVLSRDPPPAERKMLDIISRQTVMMRRLVDDLLELERITHGHIELKRDRVDLAECLQRAVAAVQSTVDGRQQALVLRLPSESVLFMADSTRLDQIVGNLLTNASKYTGRGGRIEISGERTGDAVIVRCKDNGQGIPPEYQQKIFDPFATGPKTTLGYGEASVGLGLALVKQLTELHRGTVSVESGGMGLGSTFTVRLPLVTPPTAEVPGPAGTSPRTQSIVIVEDNPSVAVALQAALEQAGHSVSLFADGPSTLAKASSLTPDVFLIDIGLPGMDGYELLAKLKQPPNTRSALCIAISGFKRREPADTHDRFDWYFNKPVDVAALLAFLDQR